MLTFSAKTDGTIVYATHDDSPFLFTAANFDSAFGHYFEAFFRAVSGTANARLYDNTAAAAVAGSELSTMSSSNVRLRSGSLTLVDGNVYVAQFGTSAADSAARKSAQVLSY